MLQIQDLSTETHALLAHYSLDYFAQEYQHLLWRDLLPSASFMRLRGYTVLVPFPEDQRPYIEVERMFLETHRSELALLLKYRSIELPPRQILAVCHWFLHEPFYITVLFHHCKLPTRIAR